jgi:hypothetical protein
MQLQQIGLGNQFVVHVFDLDHEATMQRFVLMSMGMVVGSESCARGR